MNGPARPGDLYRFDLDYEWNPWSDVRAFCTIPAEESRAEAAIWREGRSPNA